MFRIAGLADVFDALTSKRPYKDPYPIEKTCEIIQAGRGKHFDPHLVDLFLGNLEMFKKIKAEIARGEDAVPTDFQLSERDRQGMEKADSYHPSAALVDKFVIWDKETFIRRIDNDQELIKKLIDYFVSVIDEKVDSIEKAISKKDWQSVEKQAHTVKGMLANISGERAREEALNIEIAASSDTPQKCENKLQHLRKEIKSLVKLLTI